MTNFEFIRTMPIESFSKFLCDNSDCDVCLASEYCHYGHNGMKDWLESEYTESDYTFEPKEVIIDAISEE